MKFYTIFAVIASFSGFIRFSDSAPLNGDFVSPDELEAIRNQGQGQKLDNRYKPIPAPPVVQKVPAVVHKVPTPVLQNPAVHPNPFNRDSDAPPVWGVSSGSSANAQSQAQNVHNGKEQTAGANSYNNVVNNAQGQFQNSGASSIGGNVAQDGSSAQLTASNVQKNQAITADGYKNQETSQAQSANFDKKKGTLQTSDANTNLEHTIDKTGERKKVGAAASSMDQNQHGSSGNQAQANTIEYNENGIKGTKTEAVGQSSQINKDGSTSNAHTHSGTNTYETADGQKVTESKAGSSSVNQGQHGVGGSGANCGSSGTSSGTSHGGGFSSSSSSSSSSSFTNANGQTFSGSDCSSGSKTGTGPGIVPPFNFGAFQPFPIQQFPYQGHPFVG